MLRSLARQDGWTPLNIASHKGHVEVVGALLAKGVDVEAKDNVSLRQRRLETGARTAIHKMPEQARSAFYVPAWLVSFVPSSPGALWRCPSLRHMQLHRRTFREYFFSPLRGSLTTASLVLEGTASWSILTRPHRP